MIRLIALLSIASSSLFGENALIKPSDLPAPEQKVDGSSITKLENGNIQIGKVILDPKTREIRLPAKVNQTSNALEFILVHIDGKTHESLLNTDISATKLNIAFKLVGYKASRELYKLLKKNGTIAKGFESATEEEKKESRISIDLEWEENGEKKSTPIHRWISHSKTEKLMTDSAWVYGGSFFQNGKIVAETSGDLIAIELRNSAMVNFSGKDRDLNLGEFWIPHASRVPEVGTEVTVVIKPYKSQ